MAHENIKKLPLKVAYGSLDFFSLQSAPTAQNGPKLQIHFENLAVTSESKKSGQITTAISLLRFVQVFLTQTLDLSLHFLSRDHTKDG